MTSASLPGQPADASVPGQSPHPTPQLRRSATDRMAGGVCGGLAEYSGIDALLWRIGFVALTLTGGAGVLVYLLLWVLVPSAPLPPGKTPSPVEDLIGRLSAAAERFRRR